jgi:hypothetical protein
MILGCASPLIYAAVQRCGVWALAVLLAVWLVPYDVPLVQTRAILFYALGAYLAVRHPDVLEFRARRAAWLMVPWVVLVVLKVLLEARSERYFDQILTAATLLGVPALWFAIDMLPEQQMDRLRRAGPYSFFVILAHEPAQGGVLKVVTRTLGSQPWVDAVAFAVVPAAVMIALVAIAMLLERRIPKVLAFATGGRSKLMDRAKSAMPSGSLNAVRDRRPVSTPAGTDRAAERQPG